MFLRNNQLFKEDSKFDAEEESNLPQISNLAFEIKSLGQIEDKINFIANSQILWLRGTAQEVIGFKTLTIPFTPLCQLYFGRDTKNRCSVPSI